MEKQNSEDLSWLEEWSGKEVPEKIANLPPEQLHSLRDFVEETYESKIRAVKKAIMANELTLKFIPNFITVQILKSFIEPEMAALIGETLPLPLTLPIIQGLDAEYIAQAGVYLKADVGAEIFLKLDRYKMQKVIERLLTLKPLKVLDILHHIPENKRKNLPLRLNPSQFVGIHLSETRQSVIANWT